MSTKIKVSVCCITYNHERFIKQALESFIHQIVDFEIEILVYDDASTDSTQEIISSIVLQYPRLIKPIYSLQNQFSKGVRPIGKFNFNRAQGKYIAMCEGDDYWTDPYKLQKQVDFLENNPEYVLCVGGYKTFNTINQIEEKIVEVRGNNQEGFSFTLNDMANQWITKTLTAVFINNREIIEQLNHYRYACDVNLNYHLLKDGKKGYYFSEVFGVYRIHDGGIFSNKQQGKKLQFHYNVYKELHLKNRDEYTRGRFFRFSALFFNHKLYNFRDYGNLLSLIDNYFESLKMVRSFNDLKLVIRVLLPKK